MKPIEEYTEDSIVVLEGLEAVRVRPSMYIGILTNGQFQILKEACDNALDECTSGFSRKVEINIGDDGYFTVSDEGRGIPVGPHPKQKDKSTLEIVMTKLHAGGKLKDGAYSSGSSGTHGVGISCTNALSTDFQVWTNRDGKWYTQKYSKGIPLCEVKKEKPEGNYKKGTIVRFKPDSSILSTPLDIKQVMQWVRNSSFLNAGVEFVITYKGQTKTLKSKGLSDYLQYITKDLNCEPLNKPFILKTENCDVALQWFESDDSILESWCNSSRTSDGGTHLQGLINVINKCFDNMVKKKEYKSEDLRIGLYGALNFRISQPQFQSQTKEKLINPEATKLVMEQIEKEFEKYLNSNKSFVKKVIDRANELRSIYNKFTQEKKALSKLKTRGRANLPPAGKFIVSNCKESEKRELFIVEGDSAGGTARQARNPYHQEVLKLRGKILNIAKSSLLKAYESDDILNILKAIGFDPVNKERQLRVGKVIFLTDADVDGQHISLLLLTLIQKIYPELLKEGRVFAVNAPLFVGKTKTATYYGESLEDLKKKSGNKLETVTRLKGWGEASADLLRTFAFNTETRKLFQITDASEKETNYFKKIVGDDVSVRKKLLEEI